MSEDRPRSAAAARWSLISVGLLVLLLPLYFSILRSALFNTTPRDDYADYLLFMAGEGGGLPNSPFGYRMLSVLPAVPFFRVLPTIEFTTAPDYSEEYLRATGALAMLSYVAIVLTAVAGAAIYTRHLRGDTVGAVLAGGALFILVTTYGSLPGVDPVAIFVISLLVLVVDRPWVFGLLVIVGSAVNEKIVLVFAVAFVVRALVHAARRRTLATFQWWAQTAASVTGLLLYVSARVLVALPGHEAQTDPGAFLGGLSRTLVESVSARGFVLTIIPLVVVSVSAALALRGRAASDGRGSSCFRPGSGEVVAVLALVGVAAVADVGLNVGRIAVYVLPIFVPWAMHALFARTMRASVPATRASTTAGFRVGWCGFRSGSVGLGLGGVFASVTRSGRW